MEDHLLAVQFILIQSGGKAEQRVNAAHIHILPTSWGRAHRHTLYIYTNTHAAEKTHTVLCHITRWAVYFLTTVCSKCNLCDFYMIKSYDWIKAGGSLL